MKINRAVSFLGGVWRRVRGPLAVVGLGFTLCSGWIVFWLAHDFLQDRHMILGSQPVSPVARELAEKIAPGLQDIARRIEPSIVSRAPNPVARWATHRVYPYLVERIPEATEIGMDNALSRFGQMPLGDVAKAIVEHARYKGETPHASYRDPPWPARDSRSLAPQ